MHTHVVHMHVCVCVCICLCVRACLLGGRASARAQYISSVIRSSINICYSCHNDAKTISTAPALIFAPCTINLLLISSAEHLDPINVKIAELREALASVTAEQKYLKAREARHHHSKQYYKSFDR